MSAWLKVGAAAGAAAWMVALGCGPASAAPAPASPWGAPPVAQGSQPQSDCERPPTSEPPIPTDGTACCKFPNTWVKTCPEEYGHNGSYQCVFVYACERPPKQP